MRHEKEKIMAIRKPRFEPAEFARRGDDILQRVVQPSVRPDQENQFVAIDIESEQFELDSDDYAASERLLKRVPDAQIWIARIGHPAAYRVGSVS
jgi:hypothetical protein